MKILVDGAGNMAACPYRKPDRRGNQLRLHAVIADGWLGAVLAFRGADDFGDPVDGADRPRLNASSHGRRAAAGCDVQAARRS